MKSISKLKALRLLTTAFLIIVLFSQCNKKAAEPKCCEGYTGKLTNPNAERLVKQCHFIPADSIEVWTKRYQESKKRGTENNVSLPGLGEVLGDSSSFNSCIIRKIISDEKCIGLRVIYGMSEDKKIHVILAGINPDYSTLYIKEPEECCPGNTKQVQMAPAGDNGKIGGAEYGQLP
ncbi:MAG: hypothetical protein ABIQ31_00200 [Ferruginibacter sp.]